MLTPPQPEGPAGASDADTCAPLTLRWFLGGSRSVAQVKDPQHLLLHVYSRKLNTDVSTLWSIRCLKHAFLYFRQKMSSIDVVLTITCDSHTAPP